MTNSSVSRSEWIDTEHFLYIFFINLYLPNLRCLHVINLYYNKVNVPLWKHSTQYLKGNWK